MNYCFNCGAKLIEKDQKFCIKCGTKLVEHEDKYKDYLKESHSKYNKREGESYNDYLERINSPLKDKIATEDEIEKEKEDYINYDPLKTYKEIYYFIKVRIQGKLIVCAIEFFVNEI